MKEYTKRDSCMTMEEVIERNTGMSLKAFLTPQPNPYIHNMDRAVEFFFERYIEENKDDILELLGILGAFFVMWWITVAIEADKIFKATLIMVIGFPIVMIYEKCIHE